MHVIEKSDTAVGLFTLSLDRLKVIYFHCESTCVGCCLLYMSQYR